jgi:RHS repeat-associated protein
MLLNSAGLVLADCACTAWGNCNSASYLPTPFGWKGQSGAYRDSETGLVQMGARYFSPALGRFLSRDPIAFAGGVNIYAYCDGDPIDYADPTGLCGESIGDVFAQLRNGDTWREGIATSGYALGSLLTLGRAFGEYSNRPGFEASRACWGVGAASLTAAGAVAMAPAVVQAVGSSSLYTSWAAGGGTGAAGVVGKKALDALEEGAGGSSSIVINVAGEGEVPGAINVQGPWVFAESWPGSADGGLTLQELEAQGHVFLQVERLDQLPFETGSVDIVYTNSVPVGGFTHPEGFSSYLGPYPQADEILRVLKVGGKWLHDGVEVP